MLKKLGKKGALQKLLKESKFFCEARGKAHLWIGISLKGGNERWKQTVTFCNEGDVTRRLPRRFVLGSLPLHPQAQAGSSLEGVKFCSVGKIWCEKNTKEFTWEKCS